MITSLSPGLSDAYQETIKYWAPDTPPTTIALSELGHRVVDQIRSVEPATNDAIFKAIEDALAEGELELTTAVATGMIEGIVGRATSTGIWDEVLPRLGKLSASHARQWEQYGS
jgi:hypothetical protein